MKHPTNELLALPTYQAGMIQAAAYRNLNAFLNRELQPAGLSVNEWALLGLLTDGPVHPQEIARVMCVKSPMVPRLVEALLARNLATVTADSKDQRGKHVAITKSGSALLESTESRLRGAMQEYLSAVPRSDLATYIKVMSIIAQKH